MRTIRGGGERLWSWGKRIDEPVSVLTTPTPPYGTRNAKKGGIKKISLAPLAACAFGVAFLAPGVRSTATQFSCSFFFSLCCSLALAAVAAAVVQVKVYEGTSKAPLLHQGLKYRTAKGHSTEGDTATLQIHPRNE